MTICEMCGKEANLVNADVEGVELKLCSNCSKYGVVKKNPNKFLKKQSFYSNKKFIKKDKPEFRLVHNYPSLLKSARESKGMNQEDFANFLNERVSIITKWESGNLKPQIGIARKLEKILGVILVEEDKKKIFEQKDKRREESFTLGDFIKVRKRK